MESPVNDTASTRNSLSVKATTPKVKWSSTQIRSCQIIANRAGAFVWLYEETTEYYQKQSMFFTILIAIGNYVFGSTGIPTLFATGWEGIKYITLGIQICVIIMGIIGTIFSVLDYNKKITRTSWALTKYNSIFLEINKELRKDIDSIADYTTFYTKIIDDENEVKSSAVPVPDKIFTRYYSLMSSKALTYNELFLNHMNLTEGSAIKKVDTIHKLDKYL